MSTATQNKYDVQKYKTPTGTQLSCKGWIQEAALRMLLNNLDPAVAERPDDLIVYGGRGKAARNFEALDNIIAALKVLENDESLLIQSGKPVAILKTHKDAPRVLISNSQLVPKWATWEHFDELEKKGFDDVRTNDCRFMDIHRLTRNCTRYLRNLFCSCRQTFRRNVKRHIECYSRSWWDGWSSTFSNHNERRCCFNS
jgi:hypothetical protein